MKVTGKAVQVKAEADALTQLKERFATWRAVRKLGMRIPPELWAAAVEMVAVHGACRVAGELTLDYDMLKQWVAMAGGVEKSKSVPNVTVNVSLGVGDDGPQWPKRHSQEERWIALTRDDARAAEGDGAEHGVDLAVPVVLDWGAPMTSSAYTAQFMNFFHLGTDDRLLQVVKQPLAVIHRETNIVGPEGLTRTIDSSNLHASFFAKISDQVDANDNLHEWPRHGYRSAEILA